MRYSANISAGSLKVPESRIVAGLLLRRVTDKEWHSVIVDENALQARTASIAFLTDHIPKQKPGLRVKLVNLLDLVVQHLKDRNLLDRSFQLQKERGDRQLLKVLEPVLDAEKIAPVFAQAADPDHHDLVLVSGVGSVFPLLRTHNLLNNLHSRMGKTPLVMFYPGRYDGKYLRLFGRVKPSPYYRAFQLIP